MHDEKHDQKHSNDDISDDVVEIQQGASCHAHDHNRRQRDDRFQVKQLLYTDFIFDRFLHDQVMKYAQNNVARKRCVTRCNITE